MTKSGYPYPPDEFDVAVPGGAPVGVHRAPRSGWSSAWPFLLVAVVCAAVAWGGITLLSGGDDPAEASGDGSPSTAASASASPSGEPSASPSTSASAPGAGESAGQYPGDPAKANKSAETIIGVYNNGGDGMDQMATVAQTNLQAAGFQGEITPKNTGADANSPAVDSVTANTVLYGGDRADTASAVAETLGIDPANVKPSEETGEHPTEGVWVILVTPLSS